MGAFANIAQQIGNVGNDVQVARDNAKTQEFTDQLRALQLRQLQMALGKTPTPAAKYTDVKVYPDGKQYGVNVTTGRIEKLPGQDDISLNQKLTMGKGEPLEGSTIGRAKGTYWIPMLDAQGNVVTYAPTGTPKSAKPTAFESYMNDPENYKRFLKESADAKQTTAKNAGFMSVYSIYRLIDAAYKDNPALLPFVAAMAPQVFKQAGMDIPPEVTKILGQVPVDQPLSPETGQPIGLSMPGAPTGATKTEAQTAARVIKGDPNTGISPLNTIRQEVTDLSGYLGPVQGRVNVKYLLGKIGSTGDPTKDQALSKLRTDLMFLGSAAAKFHLNAVRAMTQFESLADAGKDSAPALQGFLNSMEEWANAAQRQEQGFGEAPGAGKAPPSGSNVIDLGTFLKGGPQ